MRALLIVLCLLFSGVVVAHANVDLQAEHGENLDKASFPIRFKFQKSTGMVWKESSYEDRKSFLEGYYNQLADEDKAKRDTERQELQEQREIDQVKRDADREIKEKVKARADAKKEAEKKKDAEKKRFDQYVKEKQKEVDELRKTQQSSRR